MNTIQLDYIYQEHPKYGQKFDTSIHISKKSSVSYGVSAGSFAKIVKIDAKTNDRIRLVISAAHTILTIS